jgi:hypothetical protein
VFFAFRGNEGFIIIVLYPNAQDLYPRWNISILVNINIMLELILFFEDNQRANNMTTRRLTTVVATTLLSLGLAIGGSVSLANEEKGNAAEHKFELARQYYGTTRARFMS